MTETENYLTNIKCGMCISIYIKLLNKIKTEYPDPCVKIGDMCKIDRNRE